MVIGTIDDVNWWVISLFLIRQGSGISHDVIGVLIFGWDYARGVWSGVLYSIYVLIGIHLRFDNLLEATDFDLGHDSHAEIYPLIDVEENCES